MRIVAFCSLLSILFCPFTARAQATQPQTTPVPALMNFQGRLAKPDGTPVPDGTYSLTFRIFDAQVDGTKRWEQTMNPVLVRNGVFAVLLGNGNPLEAAVFNNTPYLEVQIGTDAPLSPRQAFASVSYAFKANTVPDGAIGTAQIADNAITTEKIKDGGGHHQQDRRRRSHGGQDRGGHHPIRPVSGWRDGRPAFWSRRGDLHRGLPQPTRSRKPYHRRKAGE